MKLESINSIRILFAALRKWLPLPEILHASRVNDFQRVNFWDLSRSSLCCARVLLIFAICTGAFDFLPLFADDELRDPVARFLCCETGVFCSVDFMIAEKCW